MSELLYYLTPKPAWEPIETRGNWFWRDGERFLVKGINYFIRESQDGSTPTSRSPKVDVLSDEHLDSLRRDIDIFHELRLNTVSVSSLSPDKDHRQALRLLAESGLYVLVTIGEGIASKGAAGASPDRALDTQALYTPELATQTLRLVDQLAGYHNILGLQVDGSSISTSPSTKTAEVMRALVRDIKTFLRHRGGRRIPVGVHNRELVMHRKPALEYFTASDPTSRADFFAIESWSWAHNSSFQISGWKNMVAMLGTVPVPMFLSQYGTQVGKVRIWQEVECLYSPDMTGVFSGGCLYTLHEYGNRYGIVETDERGILRRKYEFGTLKGRFKKVGRRSAEQRWTEESKDYEGWRGQFPALSRNTWMATESLPECPLDTRAFSRKLDQEKASGRIEGLGPDIEALTTHTANLSINDH